MGKRGFSANNVATESAISALEVGACEDYARLTHEASAQPLPVGIADVAERSIVAFDNTRFGLEVRIRRVTNTSPDEQCGAHFCVYRYRCLATAMVLPCGVTAAASTSDRVWLGPYQQSLFEQFDLC